MDIQESKNNPKYIIEKYLKVYSYVEGDYVPFVLTTNQLNVIYAYENNHHNTIKKFRQAGISTITQAYMAVKVAFSGHHNPEVVGLIGPNMTMSERNLKEIKRFLLRLPRWVWGPDYYGSEENEKKDIFIINNKRKVVLPNGSEINVLSTSSDGLKGYDLTYLVIDEAAFIDNGQFIQSLSSLIATITPTGRIIMVSTPNGLDSLFYKSYILSMSYKNHLNILNLNWWEDYRFNKSLKWVLKVNGEVIDEVVDISTENHSNILLVGYKPTSPWYENMCMVLNNNSKHIEQELDAKFVI